MLAGELEDQPRVDRPEHRPSRRAPARAGPRRCSSSHCDLRAPRSTGRAPGRCARARAARARPRAAPRSARRCGGPATRSRCAAARPSRDPTRTPSRAGWRSPPPTSSPARTPGVGERLARDRLRDLPDLARVVLDPAGLREVLGELAVGAADRLGPLVEHDAGRAGRSLVDREDHLRREPTCRARYTRTKSIELRPRCENPASVRPVARWARSSSISATRCPARTRRSSSRSPCRSRARTAARPRARARATRAARRSAPRSQAAAPADRPAREADGQPEPPPTRAGERRHRHVRLAASYRLGERTQLAPPTRRDRRRRG